jgi:hypothetical protein
MLAAYTPADNTESVPEYGTRQPPYSRASQAFGYGFRLQRRQRICMVPAWFEEDETATEGLAANQWNNHPVTLANLSSYSWRVAVVLDSSSRFTRRIHDTKLLFRKPLPC